MTERKILFAENFKATEKVFPNALFKFLSENFDAKAVRSLNPQPRHPREEETRLATLARLGKPTERGTRRKIFARDRR